jgi:hypothetical protein
MPIVSQVWERREFYTVLWDRNHLERLWSRRHVADNVVFKETACEVVAWNFLGQDREKWRVNMVIIFKIL